ncbi:MAG: IclR family transcriptional regulator, partial [Actinobacteria bacterium]|nr:IclR family transcriptional regulator [Actinomycetota bacterium]
MGPVLPARTVDPQPPIWTADRRAVSSVANAARVLKAFRGGRRELGVTELARQLDLAKSTAHRLVSTLVGEHLLERDDETGRYRLSITMMELGDSVPIHEEIYTAARPVMEHLRSRTNQLVHVDVRRGREVVYVERAETAMGARVFRHRHREWVHCTSTGRVLLADLPRPELDRLLRGWELPQVTPNTIVAAGRLRS